MTPATPSPSITLAKALIKATSEILYCPMDSTNPQFKSKYASLESVLKTLKPILAKNGLGVTQLPLAPGKILTIVMHESGDSMSWTTEMPFNGTKAQEVGSLISYLRRYALVSFFGMVGDHDDDGNEASKELAAPEQNATAIITAAALKNEWAMPQLVAYISKTFKKASVGALNREEQERLWKTVTNFKFHQLDKE